MSLCVASDGMRSDFLKEHDRHKDGACESGVGGQSQNPSVGSRWA